MYTEFFWLGFLIFVLICIQVDIILYMKHKKKESENAIKVASLEDATERLKIYSEFDFDKIDERIDRYINDAGMKYKIEHFEYKDRDEIYLNQEDMEMMIKEMINEVMKKITPAIFDLIRMSYNVKNQEELIEFLCEKIKLYVLNYSFETNAEIEDEEKSVG